VTDAGAPEPGEDGAVFRVRKWVKPEDINQLGTLFGGSLLRWIDEEAAIVAIYQLGRLRLVTKFVSEIDFVHTAHTGDLIELAFRVVAFGRTSLTLRCDATNVFTGDVIVEISRIVFVSVDEEGRATPHGRASVALGRERIPVRR